MGSDDEKELEGLRRIAGDAPLGHDCENCGDGAMAPVSQIPAGWRYVAVSEKLWESTDDVDSRTTLLCTICVGLIRRVVPKFGTVGTGK